MIQPHDSRSGPGASDDLVRALDHLRRGIHRRWGLAIAASGVLLLEWALQDGPFPLIALTLVLGLSVLVNAVGGQILVNQSLEGWTPLFSPAADILIVLTMVLLTGSPAAPLLLLLAVVPHSFDHDPRAVDALLIGSVMGYLSAAWLHTALVQQIGMPSSSTLASVAVYSVVAWALLQSGARRAARLRRAQQFAGALHNFDLTHRPPPDVDDDLGLLVRDLGRVGRHWSRELRSMRIDLAEAASEADVAANRMHTLRASFGSASAGLQTAVRELTRQRELAERSWDRGLLIEGTLGAIRESAAQVNAERTQVGQSVQTVRSTLERAVQGLRTAREAVASSATLVGALGDRTVRIATTAESLAGVARQTHVLALNAAIEAAQSEGGSDSFAVVADEIHSLAGEAGGTIRDAVRLVAGLQKEVDAATHALESSVEHLNAVEALTGESSSALGQMERTVDALGDLASDLPDTARQQGRQVEALLDTLREASTTLQETLDASGALPGGDPNVGLTDVQDRLARISQCLRHAATTSELFRVAAEVAETDLGPPSTPDS